MINFFYRSISIVMHPLFMITYVFLFLLIANPFLFGFSGPKAQGVITISIVTTSLMFPLIAILLMKATGLIRSLEMEDKLERIGPLIVTGIFFLWLYVNIRRHDTIPDAFTFFVLGSTIGVFMALVINSFSKISLHSIGAGGLLMGMGIIIWSCTDPQINIPNPFGTEVIRMSQRLFMSIIVLLVGLVGTARLHLRAHVEHEIYGGYLIGIISQLIAYVVVFG